MKVSSIQPTPNPNAFKFLVDSQLAPSGQTRSYEQPEQATSDVLAQSLFGVPGVETLFFCDNFVTVSMTGEADWRSVAEQITGLLESHEGAAPAPAAGGSGAPADSSSGPLENLPKGADPELLGRVTELLDQRVRPALAGDGGGLEVMGMDGKTLYIRYQGACGSCPSATAGTLMAIQNLLQSEIDEEIVVAPS